MNKYHFTTVYARFYQDAESEKLGRGEACLAPLSKRHLNFS